MLDYILSKAVMLLFLLLTVSAFMMVKDSLANYFIQQSAMQFANSSVSRISAIVSDSTAMGYREVIPLAPGISGGGKQMAYEVNILCKREGPDSVLIGFAVLDPMGKMIAFAPTTLSNPTGSIEFNYCFPSGRDYVALSTESHYLIVEKTLVDGTLVVSVCPSRDGIKCDCTPTGGCK